MENSQKQSDERKRTEGGTIDELYMQILELEPKIVTDFVPDNGKEQKEAFLSGEVHNPNNHYPNLESKDYAGNAQTTEHLGRLIAESKELNPKFAGAYGEFVGRFVKVNRMLECARDMKTVSDDDRETLAKEYMDLNQELYGEPEEEVYRSLLSEKVAKITDKNMSGRAEEVRKELIDLLGSVETDSHEERFKPSDETIQWMHTVAESLYGSMLEHIPDDKASFSAEEAKAVIETIIHEEFGEAAEGWSVDIEDAQSVNVKAAENRIVIPVDREISTQAMRSVIVTHEIGVHMLRAIQGESTDLKPLRTGLAGYGDSEEGLGVVMQQAYKGEYREAGVDHYVTIGLAYFDDKDFRDTFEIKWRLSALTNLKTEDLTDQAISKAKSTAYGATMRTFRGTDSLPLFKDLSYYNGARDVWQHLESIRGDDLKFSLVFLGKANPANKSDERLLLETRSI